MKGKWHYQHSCLIWIAAALAPLAWGAPIEAFAQGESGDLKNRDLNERILQLEKENENLSSIIQELSKRLEKLENNNEKKDGKPKDDKPKDDKPTGDKPKKENPEVDSAAVKELEPEMDAVIDAPKKETSWLPSLKGETFQLGGRLQTEFYERETDSRFQSAFPENDGGTFHIDELRLYLDADFKNKISFHGAFDFEPNDASLTEAYFEVEELPLRSDLLIGLQPRFFRPSRHTETYPLTGRAFWQSRDIGVTWKGNYDPATAYLAVTNGVELDAKQLGEDDSARMISDDNNAIDLEGGKEFSAGLGIEHDFGAFGKVELTGFGVLGELSSKDILFLQGSVPGYGFSQDDSKAFAGANFDYSIEAWDFFAQFIAGEDGGMDRTSWYAELSRLWEFGGLRYLNSIRPIVRYGVLDVDLPPRPFVRNGSLVWDRRQWLFGVSSEIVRNVNFRFEYMLNEEDTGGPAVDNDEFLFQLEMLF